MTTAALEGHGVFVPTHRCRHCSAEWRLNPARLTYPPSHPLSRDTWSIAPSSAGCGRCEADTLEACVVIPPMPGASRPDAVHHPPHYTQGKVECIDALEAATVDLLGVEAVCTAAAIKYLWRWKRKNGAEDLKKARWYIERLLAHLEGK
ncbi:MAG: hypothetical protein AMXMBFR56_72610 [Polyangiaceae bacterium]